METGIYKSREPQKGRYYVVVEEEKITMHPVTKSREGWVADTTKSSVLNLVAPVSGSKKPITFTARSFDLDIISILIKYRPSIQGFPNQLNSDFNAAGFIGHRSDLYILSFDKDPLNAYKRRMRHFAYSIGFFAGIGATAMSPFVTNDHVPYEYDGVVFTKGVAGLVGIGNLTFGATVGLDNLLDKNKQWWIYQSKPWVGFTIGLNLN
jgi:hypothetical protein